MTPSGDAPESSQAATVYEGLSTALARARDGRAPRRGLSLALAGRGVELTFGNDSLAALILPVVGHLQPPAPETETALRITLWSGADASLSAKARQPPSPEPSVTYSPDGRFASLRHGHLVACLDRKTQEILGWTSDERLLAAEQRGQPLYPLLAIWLFDHGLRVVHASLVARRGHGALFVGAGRTGKTTCALACLEAGFRYLGDDRIAIACDDDRVVGHSIYASARIDRKHASRFAGLATALAGAEPTDDQKAVVNVTEAYPGGAAAATTIRALVVPRVDGRGPSRLSSVSGGRALLALAPSSLRAMAPQPATGAMADLAALVERLPCFSLVIGERPNEIPACVAQALAEACQ